TFMAVLSPRRAAWILLSVPSQATPRCHRYDSDIILEMSIFLGRHCAKVRDFPARFPSLASALRHAVLGSSRSRSPSPRRLSPSTVSAIAPPGNTANHGFIDRKL